MKEADSAACGKEHVKLGQQPHLGKQPAEWKRQRAPAVHMEEGNPIPARPQRFLFIYLFYYFCPHKLENTTGAEIQVTAQLLHIAPSFAVDLDEWKVTKMHSMEEGNSYNPIAWIWEA